jgi:hypothetical protein
MKNTFDHLLILGRPASGKSEFLDFMSKLCDADRAERFHIGAMEVLDDFVWLWAQFEEDDLWEKVTGKRLHGSFPEGSGYVNTAEQFDFMMAKFDREIGRRYISNEDFYKDHTLLIEFARGGITPYAKALPRLGPEIYRRAAILYVEVSGVESRRRNVARYKEKLRHSVLAHKVPDRVMDLFYADDDWPQLTGGRREGTFSLSGVDVPYVTMHNEPESIDPAVLAPRYGEALNKLWELRI